MRALVVYESMYGNTHQVADAIGRGLAPSADVEVVPVDQALGALVDAADLLVVGGPTHVHGMSRDRTREQAIADANKPDRALELDADAEGEGLRDWFDGLSEGTGVAAAFDTRIDMAAAFTGRASKGIGRRLRRHGRELVREPMSFLVDKENRLLPDESARAEQWGWELGRTLASSAATP